MPSDNAADNQQQLATTTPSEPLVAMGAPRLQCPACAVTGQRRRGTKNGFELLSCTDCGTLYTATLPAAEGGEDYDGYYSESNLSTPVFVQRRLDEIVQGFSPYRSNGRLLDVGFGAGDLMQAAARAGWQVAGAEVSAPAAEQARSRGFDVFHGELAAAHYPDAAFDVVAAVEVFEHVPDPLPMLREIARILRPGGLLWATTPHIAGLSGHLIKLQWSVVNPPEHLQLFSIQGMQQALALSGFQRSRVLAEGVNPYEIMQVLRPQEPTAAPPDAPSEEEAAQDDEAEVTPGSARVLESYRLNEYMVGSPARRLLKGVINKILSTSHLGDSLKVWAVR